MGAVIISIGEAIAGEKGRYISGLIIAFASLFLFLSLVRMKRLSVKRVLLVMLVALIFAVLMVPKSVGFWGSTTYIIKTHWLDATDVGISAPDISPVGPKILLGVIIVSIVGYGVLVWRVLAPSNRFYTFVDEGTAKIVLKGGKFSKALIQWEGYTLNRDTWDVVPDGKVIKEKKWKEPFHLFGGLRFYGLWPLWDIGYYRLRWWDYQLTERATREPKFHEEYLDYVLLKPDVYWTKIGNAETKVPEERIPVDVDFLVTMRVINPYKVIFRAPISWVENVMNRLEVKFRTLIATKSFDELSRLKADKHALWQEFVNDPFVKNTLKREWGVQIDVGGIEIRDINMTKEYQDALAAQRRQQLEAAGRASETVGTVVEMLAQLRGKTVEQIKQEIDTSPDLQAKAWELANDLIVRKLGIEGKSYLDVRVQGGNVLDQILLNALAAFKRMPPGGSSSP
jgi:hypothetical protein